MKLKSLRLLVFFIIIFLPVSSEAVKIVTWNILNFPHSSEEIRAEDYRLILKEIDTDLLVVQEMISHAGVDQFLKEVLNNESPRLYKKAPFFDGPDTDNAVFYKKKILKLISHQQIPTPLRDISEYYFKIKGGTGKRTKFRLYSVHLKSGTSSDDRAEREEEANILREYLNTLPPDSLFVVCGDFNFYENKEAAFELLTESQADNDGRLKDPIDELGTWHDKKKYANIHTQSTRKEQFGGGASGGLDDRFDMFLISYGLDGSEKLTYKPGSYVVFGNDGKHLNKAVIYPKNNSVSEEIADALHEASDHLPVIIELDPPGDDIPLKPTRLEGKAVSSSEIQLTWKDNSDNEDGFIIERKHNTNWTQIADVYPDTVNYKDTGLIKNTTYTYRVYAYNDSGNSEYSNKISTTTKSEGGITVYITETGSKYHFKGCRYLSKSKIAISLTEACKKGYTPCSVCKPPKCPSVIMAHSPNSQCPCEEFVYRFEKLSAIIFRSLNWR